MKNFKLWFALLGKQHYEQILSLKIEIMNDPNWLLVDCSHCYVGGSEQDIDWHEIYYNQRESKAIECVINYDSKQASIHKVPMEQLGIPVQKQYGKK